MPLVRVKLVNDYYRSEIYTFRTKWRAIKVYVYCVRVVFVQHRVDVVIAETSARTKPVVNVTVGAIPACLYDIRTVRKATSKLELN